MHNPKPDPAVLFDIARFLLASIGSGKGNRWLAIADQEGLVPVETVRQVFLALRVHTVFKLVLLAEGERVRAL